MAKKEIKTDELISYIVEGIENVKGQDIDILDLREIENTVCDYFVICNGTSNTQVNALVGSIQKTVSKAIKDKPWHVEGSENGE
ncbi:ribosome silencing factor, partial [Croceibacter atlanticus]